MFIFNLIVLSLIPVATFGQLVNLQFDAEDQNSDLVKLVNQLVESKVEKIIEENNVKIFDKMQKQTERIVELESKFDW